MGWWIDHILLLESKRLIDAVPVPSPVRPHGVAGVRKKGTAERITLDDRFHLGSCTKAMTATLVAMLVEEGKLNWTTTLGELFADTPGAWASPWEKVTLRQVLAHRSGAAAQKGDIPLHTARHRTPGELAIWLAVALAVQDVRAQRGGIELRGDGRQALIIDGRGHHLAKVGRAVPCPPPPANERVLIHHDGAHGVTRPTSARRNPRDNIPRPPVFADGHRCRRPGGQSGTDRPAALRESVFNPAKD